MIAAGERHRDRLALTGNIEWRSNSISGGAQPQYSVALKGPNTQDASGIM